MHAGENFDYCAVTSASDDSKIHVCMHSAGASIEPTIITTTISPMDALHTTVLPQFVLDDPFLNISTL